MIYRRNAITIPDIGTFVNVEHIPKVADQMKEEIETDIEIEELSKVLAKTKSISSPGWDGFSYNFMKEFWSDLKYLFKKVIDEENQSNPKDESGDFRWKVAGPPGNLRKVKIRNIQEWEEAQAARMNRLKSLPTC